MYPRAIFLVLFILLNSGIANARNLDIIGIQLGTPLEAALSVLKKHFEGRSTKRYYLRSSFVAADEKEKKKTKNHIFKDGILFADITTLKLHKTNNPNKINVYKLKIRELIALYYDANSKNQDVFAIVRSVDLKSFDATLADAKRGLEDKYGKYAYERFRGNYIWMDQAILNSLMSDKSRNRRERHILHATGRCWIFGRITAMMAYRIRGSISAAYYGFRAWFDEKGNKAPFVFGIKDTNIKADCGKVINASVQHRGLERKFFADTMLIDTSKAISIKTLSKEISEVDSLTKPGKPGPALKF